MARFEQVVLSNDDDEYGIPRFSGVAVINTDEIQTVEAGMGRLEKTELRVR